MNGVLVRQNFFLSFMFLGYDDNLKGSYHTAKSKHTSEDTGI